MDNDDTQNTPSSPFKISKKEMTEYDSNEAEARTYLNYTTDAFTGTQYAMLSSPHMQGHIKIKNPTVPISTSA